MIGMAQDCTKDDALMTIFAILARVFPFMFVLPNQISVKVSIFKSNDYWMLTTTGLKDSSVVFAGQLSILATVIILVFGPINYDEHVTDILFKGRIKGFL